MTIAELPAGVASEVVWVHEDGPVGERLMEMGLVPGAAVSVVRRTRFYGLVQLRVRGYVLSLRREQAAGIEVTPCE